MVFSRTRGILVAPERAYVHVDFYRGDAVQNAPNRDGLMYNALRNAFHAYVLTLFRLAGWDDRTATAHTSRVLCFKETLASFYVPKKTLQDPVAAYTRV
ncbi:hypothetical protein PsorP6_011429 [Peronosclerospora sorghi]|uniref:Uncharacterized protein n=1 Tax=Peronosclerospora sorghi TaxID=230839 RepID=A0ACC0WK95_9STRA|nr:hypothetical protein PsorP6_011429 [Peronosclerospora sorghi]